MPNSIDLMIFDIPCRIWGHFTKKVSLKRRPELKMKPALLFTSFWTMCWFLKLYVALKVSFLLHRGVDRRLCLVLVVSCCFCFKTKRNFWWTAARQGGCCTRTSFFIAIEWADLWSLYEFDSFINRQSFKLNCNTSKQQKGLKFISLCPGRSLSKRNSCRQLCSGSWIKRPGRGSLEVEESMISDNMSGVKRYMSNCPNKHLQSKIGFSINPSRMDEKALWISLFVSFV